MNLKISTKIGYIPQYARDFNPMFPATVEEVIGANIQSMKKSFKRMGKEEKDKIDQVLKIVEIEDLKKQKLEIYQEVKTKGFYS